MLRQDNTQANNSSSNNNSIPTKEKKTKKKHHLFCHKHTSEKDDQEPTPTYISQPVITEEPPKQQPETNPLVMSNPAQQQIQMLNQALLNNQLEMNNLKLQHQQEINTLTLQHQQDTDLNTYLVMLKGRLPCNEIKGLLDEIFKFEHDPTASQHKKEFIQGLKKFARALNKDITTPTRHSVENKTAYTLIDLTTQMLENLKDNSHKDKIKVLKDYEKACNITPGWKKFLKGLAVVCITAVGFVLGAAVGMGIGIAAGAWTGPGAFVTAAMGLVTGSVTGAALGVAAGTLATGVGAAALSSILLFRPTKLERAGINLGKKGEQMFRRQP